MLVALLIAAPAVARAAGPVGTTALSYDRGHGTQVEFLRRGGAAYLWYPGNKVVLRGHWRSEGVAPAQRMCFKYGPNTYNPVTHVYGDVWECEPIRVYVSTLMEQQLGDVFGLSRRRAVPFVLPPRRTTIEQLAGEVGPSAHLGPAIHLRK
jgi:hypothetical protein